MRSTSRRHDLARSILVILLGAAGAVALVPASAQQGGGSSHLPTVIKTLQGRVQLATKEIDCLHPGKGCPQAPSCFKYLPRLEKAGASADKNLTLKARSCVDRSYYLLNKSRHLLSTCTAGASGAQATQCLSDATHLTQEWAQIDTTAKLLEHSVSPGSSSGSATTAVAAASGGAAGGQTARAADAPVFLQAGIKAPQEIDPRACRPQYPKAANDAGITGVVIAEYTVTAKGEVTNVQFKRGPKVFYESVRNALAHCQMKPATKKGQILAVRMIRNFRFEQGR